MARDCRLPELGENISSATVLDVLVEVGDTVDKEQSLLSLESDKAEFELPSPAAGKISEILVKAGDEVEVGQVIVRLEDGPAGTEEAEGEPEREPERAQEKEEAAADEKEAEKPERAKAEESEKPPKAGKLEQASPKKEQKKEEERHEEPGPAVAAAPSVRRLARELGIDLASVSGTAEGGRITAEDVYRQVRQLLAGAGAPAAGDGGAGGGRDFSRWGKTEPEPMSTVRRRTAEQMSLAWSSIPHVAHHDRADITELDRLRAQFARRVEQAGGKLTITAVLLKVLGSALRRYPKFNSSVDMQAGAIVFKSFVNVGVAVDTERGLLVPVIRDVDQKNIVELARELREISEGARNRKLAPDRLQGATFTVTNLGGIGGTSFNPLINPPEVAVLGVSRAATEPVWVDGAFQPRLMLPLTVTYDHRVIDGADAARFLRWVCEALGEPFLMDLEGE